jgi:hypothetical protein
MTPQGISSFMVVLPHLAGTPATTLGVKRSLHSSPTISQIISIHLSSAAMYSMLQSSIGTSYDTWTDRRGENSAPRTQCIPFQEHQRKIIHQTSHLFAYLMIVQWVGGVIAALVITPRTWAGTTSTIHLHVWTALVLGATISSLPVFLAFTRPCHTSTRHIIAVAQMLTSALLIHLTGGRIETHFHVFGSLAFLAFYRDWRVFIPATIVVGLDHMVHGIFWPQSVYGVLSATPWRSVEHAAWVIFEDIFLILSCRRGLQEMHDIANQRVQLENTNQIIEAKVMRRRTPAADSRELGR